MSEQLPLWLVRLLNPSLPTAAASGSGRTPAQAVVPFAGARSWANAYPDVPAPSPDMALFAARWTCGAIHGEDAPEAARELLNAGFESPGLRRLARASEIISSIDIAELLEQVLREFNVPVPFPLQQARMLVTRHIARQVIAGLADPWHACARLDMIWGWTPDDEDLRSIHACMEKSNWDPELQRYVPPGVCDLIPAFARLAQRTDEQIFA